MKPRDFQFEALLTPEEVAEYLRSIAQGLENRQIQITRGTESMELAVPGSVEFRLSGKVREGERRIRVQFTLRDDPPSGVPELNIE